MVLKYGLHGDEVEVAIEVLVLRRIRVRSGQEGAQAAAWAPTVTSGSGLSPRHRLSPRPQGSLQSNPGAEVTNLRCQSGGRRATSSRWDDLKRRSPGRPGRPRIARTFSAADSSPSSRRGHSGLGTFWPDPLRPHSGTIGHAAKTTVSRRKGDSTIRTGAALRSSAAGIGLQRRDAGTV